MSGPGVMRPPHPAGGQGACCAALMRPRDLIQATPVGESSVTPPSLPPPHPMSGFGLHSEQPFSLAVGLGRFRAPGRRALLVGDAPSPKNGGSRAAGTGEAHPQGHGLIFT